MRPIFLLAILPALSQACATQEPSVEHAAVATVRMNFDEFVRSCVEEGGWNITYDQNTAVLLASTSVEAPQPLRVPEVGFEDWFCSWADAAGFSARRVGPESLRTMQLMPRN